LNTWLQFLLLLLQFEILFGFGSSDLSLLSPLNSSFLLTLFFSFSFQGISLSLDLSDSLLFLTLDGKLSLAFSLYGSLLFLEIVDLLLLFSLLPSYLKILN